MTVTIQHCRDEGFCVSGIRDWFAAHDLDFRGFVRNGIAAEDLLATGDDLARRVVARAGGDDGR